MTQRERVDRQVTKLLLVDPFIGPNLLCLDIVETKAGELAMPTAITDGVRIKYDPEFMASCTDEQVRGVLSEETYHNMMAHTFRFAHALDEHHEIANKAADQELWGIMSTFIEAQKQNGQTIPYELPPGAVYNHRWDGMSAEQIYRVMLEESEKKGGNKPGEKPGGKPGNKPGDGQGSQRPGDFERPAGTEAQQRKLEEDWKKRMVQAKQMGTLPAGLDRYVDALLNPKIPWQEKLRHLMVMSARDNYNWMKPNKAYLSLGLWLPTLHSERMGPAVIGQDTSGSMSEQSIAYGRTEAMSVLDCVRPEKLILSDIDADVHSWVEYMPGDRISLKCQGGGGSDMRPLFDRIEKEEVKPMVVIVITDLCVTFPDAPPDYPVIWLTEEKNGKAPFGEVIVMER